MPQIAALTVLEIYQHSEAWRIEHRGLPQAENTSIAYAVNVNQAKGSLSQATVVWLSVKLCLSTVASVYIKHTMVHVSVKWGKESHDVDVDTTMPGLVFKNQLYSLTGVPPDRQKIMVKGGMLQDDADLSKLNLKPKQKLMMMGTADKVRAPHHQGLEVPSAKMACCFQKSVANSQIASSCNCFLSLLLPAAS